LPKALNIFKREFTRLSCKIDYRLHYPELEREATAGYTLKVATTLLITSHFILLSDRHRFRLAGIGVFHAACCFQPFSLWMVAAAAAGGVQDTNQAPACTLIWPATFSPVPSSKD
jgi:hypothetical protein